MRGRSYAYIGEAWARWNELGDGLHSQYDRRTKFIESRLFSYGTPIARYARGSRGLYVLASTQKYSTSTATHLSVGLKAPSVPIFHVPNIGCPMEGLSDEQPLTAEAMHAANIRHFVEKYVDARETAAVRWRSYHAWHRDMRTYVNTVELYCAFTGMPEPLIDIDADLKQVDAIRKAKADAYYSPAAIAKRERAAAKREAKSALC